MGSFRSPCCLQNKIDDFIGRSQHVSQAFYTGKYMDTVVIDYGGGPANKFLIKGPVYVYIGFEQ